MKVILPEEQVQEIQLLISDLIQVEIKNFKENIGLETPYLNKEQACIYLDICNNTLDSWIKKGLPVIKVGRVVRFDKRLIDRWLSQQVML